MHKARVSGEARCVLNVTTNPKEVSRTYRHHEFDDAMIIGNQFCPDLVRYFEILPVRMNAICKCNDDIRFPMRLAVDLRLVKSVTPPVSVLYITGRE
jgi:hypothetical protein